MLNTRKTSNNQQRARQVDNSSSENEDNAIQPLAQRIVHVYQTTPTVHICLCSGMAT